MATQLSERREFEAGNWQAQCGKCGGWIAAGDPCLPANPCPEDDSFCAECHAELLQSLDWEGDLELCAACDGTGIDRVTYPNLEWVWCKGCGGKGYSEYAS